jgi:hypothetical protein
MSSPSPALFPHVSTNVKLYPKYSSPFYGQGDAFKIQLKHHL